MDAIVKDRECANIEGVEEGGERVRKTVQWQLQIDLSFRCKSLAKKEIEITIL